jgi:RNA polymerase sigma-70 factor, ECF subfamily
LQLEAFDAAYLDALRSADAETESHFVHYFSKLIAIKLRSGYRSRQLVEDVRQETFLRVFRILRSPEGVRYPERLGALVNSVCNNVLLESLRAYDRHAPGAEPRDRPARGDTADPEARLISKEQTEQVRLVMDELPARDRRILRALFFEDREKDEVCAEMGVGRDYLRVLVHRAKSLLRERMLGRQAARSTSAEGPRPAPRAVG